MSVCGHDERLVRVGASAIRVHGPEAADTLLADGYSNNLATFTTSSVLKLSSANNSGGAAEHLSSFEPAYKITPLRDWLFAQRARLRPPHPPRLSGCGARV